MYELIGIDFYDDDELGRISIWFYDYNEPIDGTADRLDRIV